MSDTLKLVRKIASWEAPAGQIPVVIGHVVEWADEPDGPKVTISTEGLDDPMVTDFFVIHGQLRPKDADQFDGLQEIARRWVVECRGQLGIADWLNRSTGYKGVSFLDAGYFYAPYVPLMQTPVMLDPASFKKSKGILTRYGKKLLEEGGKFYKKEVADGS